MRRAVELGLWLTSAAMLTAGVMRVPVVLAVGATARSHARPVESIHPRPTDSLLAAFAEYVVRNDVFRPQRQPAPQHSGNESSRPSTGATEPREAPPVLIGVAGGPPWAAVLSGVQGVDSGVVVRVGSDVGAYRVAMIDSQGIVLQARDTSIVLALRRLPR